MKITLIGKGKMGNCVAECINDDDEIVCWVCRGKIPLVKADVLIDFSSASMIEFVYDYCSRLGVPAVIATTGYSDSEFALIKELSKYVPVFYSSNMSLGIKALLQAIKSIQTTLVGINADKNIIEKHHKHKKDSPSGTAKMLQGVLNTSSTPLSIRAGNYIGEHEVIFDLDQEQISIRHTATSRKIFAIGSLNYAKQLINKPPALYTLNNL